MAKSNFIQEQSGGPMNNVAKPGSKAKKVKPPMKKPHTAGKRKGAGKAIAKGKESGPK